MNSLLVVIGGPGFLAWLQAHQVLATLVTFWIFSAAVSAMPSPKAGGSGFYQWAYGFLHNLLQFASGAIMRIPQLRALVGNGASNGGKTPPANP